MRFASKALIAVLTTSKMLAAAPAMADWQPRRPVEMVIMAGQGGGSGAEALRYLADNPENPHIVMATLNSLYTTPLRTDLGVDIAEFTPVALMAVETFLI